ncbi:hypothetical protein AMIS_19510 [Actinoplanes missouriensis 431]|uniref:Uncharacterized protein n=1 Tax=Actinoplanes missouriensis (strain ATCC 14538 / DSM 43046 / CBS 188.64 / JCM 3121 / NBRC 102363 / NCIMB 12654 / NRRL B-3342 / UNCC 431) TaxID=512565 RepID=I0H2D4_ACTM4|nr:hypothetical protein [Actinoplanes missouriensis]BAL87171.1 hypothetical protein AMIS_19510 [Actinoplanes missouriensis 431]
MTAARYWRHLRGNDLVDAQLAARWYVHADDTIGGWVVMPADLPPSSGVPAVASFLAEATARYIAELHNANLLQARNEGLRSCGRWAESDSAIGHLAQGNPHA